MLFSTVEVLDSRFDTDWLCVYEDGGFPPAVLQFDGAASAVIQQYFQDLTAAWSESVGAASPPHDTLLVRLRQLRVANKQIAINRTDRRGRSRSQNLRTGFLLVADCYRRKQEGYQPIVTINKLYTGPLNGQTLSVAFNELLHVAGGNHTSDTGSFRYSADTTFYSLDQLSVNVQDTWEHYPVMHAAAPANGLFMQFEDFQHNKAIADDYHLLYSSSDSLWHLSVSHNVRQYPWAVSDSGTIYIHLQKDVYVRTWRYHNTRCFYIPYSMPDMYTQLSLQNGAAGSGMGYAAGTSGNLLVDLGVLATEVSVSAIISGSASHKIKKRGRRSGFRYCYVDMDYGDIIYRESIPEL
ncbi:MAG: hypothetical protein JST39_25265 [Bacteroidetes bacterium]|nr:hypothetical protein [Bacteroidota bacterium]